MGGHYGGISNSPSLPVNIEGGFVHLLDQFGGKDSVHAKDIDNKLDII